MEGKQKRPAVAARCLLVIVLLLSAQQQQVAAKSAFCRCYERCYPWCRNAHLSRFQCGITCLHGCSKPLAAATAGTAGGCGVICSGLWLSLCGTVAAAQADDVQTCVAECAKNLGASAPATAAKVN